MEKTKVNEMEDGKGFSFNVPAKTIDINAFRIYLDVTYLMEESDETEIWKWHVEVGTDSNDSFDKEFDSFDEAVKYVASFSTTT